MDYAKDLSPFVPVVAIILSVGAFSLSAYQFFETRRLRRSEREKDLRLKEIDLENVIEAEERSGLEPTSSTAYRKLKAEIQHLKKSLQ